MIYLWCDFKDNSGEGYLIRYTIILLDTPIKIISNLKFYVVISNPLSTLKDRRSFPKYSFKFSIPK